MDYANTMNIELIVDLNVLFCGWLIYIWVDQVQVTARGVIWSYCLHRWYSMSWQKNSILINEHALNREPVPLSHKQKEGVT